MQKKIREEPYLDLIIQIQNRLRLQSNLVLLLLDFVVLKQLLFKYATFFLIFIELFEQIRIRLYMLCMCLFKLPRHFK